MYKVEVINYQELTTEEAGLGYFILRGIFLKIIKSKKDCSEIKILGDKYSFVEYQEIFTLDTIIKILKKFHEKRLKEKENLLEICVRLNAVYLNLLDLGEDIENLMDFV